MAVKTKKEQVKSTVIDLGSPNSEAQWKFFTATQKYIAYGGARGGGKSWAVQRKAALLALNNAGIKILILRREYGDMENSIISPMIEFLGDAVDYNKSDHMMYFPNGSTIKFGNMPGYGAAVMGKYQGQNYHCLFIDEATQFLESEFRGLAGIVRSTDDLPRHIFLTMNPGGPGHFWCKRLFVDRQFKDGEDPKDYVFIPATVDDNKDLMRANPDYVKQLDLLPEDIRRAHRYGDWNALSGVYFGEFRDGIHTCKPFVIPRHWTRYRAMDYGLDCHFCIWVAVDEKGRNFVYRTYSQSDQVVSDAATAQLQCTRADEKISYTIAPPDMWSRNRETGKSQASSFAEYGVPLMKSSNNRIQGWMALKELLKIQKDGKPNLIIFDTETELIECLKCLQHDQTVPNDVSKQPHALTHGPDALRYYAITYTVSAKKPKKKDYYEEEEEAETHSYQREICGGKPSQSYIYS